METSRSTHRHSPLSSFKLFIFFFSVFFFLLLVYDQTLLSYYRKMLDAQKRDSLYREMEIVKTRLTDHSKEALEDSYFLYSLGSQRKVRITLFQNNSVVIRDSSGKVKNGGLLDLDDNLVRLPADFWKGVPVYYSSKGDQIDQMVYFETIVLGGNANPIAVRIIKEGDPQGSRESESYLFFLKLFGGVGLLVLGLTFYRYFRNVFNRQTLFEGGEIQDSNPVFHTFQGLIQELKLKETELEKLRKLAEIRADRSETFQESILRSIGSGVITFSKIGIITSMNEAAERIFGISRKDSLGKSCAAVFGAESKILSMVNNTIDRNEPIARAEIEIVKGGSQEKIWIGVSTSLLTDEQRAFLGTTFIFTDITEIKVLQEQIELQKRLSVLGEMSAGIAHEFRNFMGTIFGYVRLLGKKAETRPEDREMTEAIITELKAMDHLIRELLSFGKTTPLHKATILLDPFFSRLIAQVSSLYKGVLPKFRIELSDPRISIEADEILMRQAFMNLVQNACEAMPDGGELTVSAKVSTFEKNPMVLVQIQDTGTGIPKDSIEKIFVPFFTRKEKGTGLGLPVVHKIILSHGGRIRVESEPGKGTLFQIYLPSGKTPD